MKKHTEDLIKEEALLLFMERGYQGTSLANIGDKVGIKKQSIYAHFKNKDELFLKVMDVVINQEMKNIKLFFKERENESLFKVLYELIETFRNRLKEKDNHLKFLIRVMFTPPPHIEKHVIENVLVYYQTLERHVLHLFHVNENELAVTSSEAALAFLNIIDGLLVELHYIDIESFDKRLQASWHVFKQGIEKEIR